MSIKNNRIIKRIAAYYDENGKVNNNIKQSTSDDNYNDNVESISYLQQVQSSNGLLNNNLLNKDLLSNASEVTYMLRYSSDNPDVEFDIKIGMCGTSFTAKNGDHIDIEWQVKAVDPSSIDGIYEYLDITQQEQEEEHTFNEQQHLQLCKDFESYTDNNFLLGILFVYKNGTLDAHLSNDRKTFAKGTSPDVIISYGNQLIRNIKQQLA